MNQMIKISVLQSQSSLKISDIGNNN